MGDARVDRGVDPGVDRLRLLVSAVAGRPVEVAVAEAGGPAWTDGVTVFVDPAAGPVEQAHTAAVQAALLAAGSLAPALVGQLRRRPALARRYLAVEGHRALAAHEPLVPPAVRPLIDRAVAASVDTPEAALALARGRTAIDDPPPAFGVIRPRRLLAAAEPADTTTQAPDQVHRPRPDGALARLDELDDDEDEDDDPDADDDVRNVGHLLSSPVGGRGVLGRLLQRLLRATREPGGGGPAGADAPTHAGRARARGRGTTTTARVPEALRDTPATATATAAFGPQARTYPEWDVHRRRYRPDWCTVHERDPRPQDLVALTVPDGPALRRPLARLGAGLDRVRRRPQGDEVDIDAVVEAQVAAQTGGPPTEAVYVESLRRRRDLAVLILLDISGSAAEPGPGGRTVHDHQRSAAAALATATHDLGDRVALYAFNSQGRTAVHVTRVKGFDDRLDGRVVRRLGGLVPGAYTRLGAAIRHGASVLDERGGTSRRLLLVLSDGFAYDHGYDGRYGEADARRALTEARRRGLGCLCLSVGGATPPAALRRVFGPAAHAAVPTLDRLPALVGPLFRAALRSAEAERRTFQRKQIEQHDERRTP